MIFRRHHILRKRALLPVLLLWMIVPLACTPGQSADAEQEEAAVQAEAAAERRAADSAYQRAPYADARTVAQRIQDAKLAARIKMALAAERDLRLFDFEPQVAGDTVRLEGNVTTREQYAHAERVAASMISSRTLINEVTINGQPAARAESTAGTDPRAAYHMVQAGESLWDIAQQYNASVGRIRSLNDLRSSRLRVGQRIRVR